MQMLILHIAALVSLAAFTLAAYAGPATPEATAAPAPRRMAMTLVALAGAGAVVWAEFAGGWRAGLAPALWLTVVCTLGLYFIGAQAAPALNRLAPLLAPYLLVLGIFATIWAHAPGGSLSPSSPSGWLGVHIAVSVVTYALFTLAAVAGAAVFAQERALKARKPNRLTTLLPAIADAERLQRRLMVLAALVLGLGLITGMTIEYLETGKLIVVSHKTVFATAAFAVIVALIGVEKSSGLAGRRVARLMLLAYLFLTLAYPGVKFVTDVLIGRG